MGRLRRRLPLGVHAKIHEKQPKLDDSPIRILERDGDIVELGIETSAGTVGVPASLRVVGDELVLEGLHVAGLAASTLGLAEARRLVRLVGRHYGVRRVRIHGGMRTTGANPGPVPRAIVLRVDEP